MAAVPRLSIGLPVYNGEEYLEEALDALLGQSYEDFELIISDNASTDATEKICRRYGAADPRIRYVRQPRSLGCAGNHNVLVELARGELFKWAADDDLYGRDLILRCVEALDRHPEVVLAHTWTAIIDGNTGDLARPVAYPLASASPSAPRRLRSMLFDEGGDDDYGVIRMEVLRKVRPYDSFYRADRVVPAEIALHGPFYQVPEWLYFRRDHPGAAEHEHRGIRQFCVNYDARRSSRWRHPVVRLLAEYVWAFFSAIRRVPLSAVDRRRCYGQVVRWVVNRALSFRRTPAPVKTPPKDVARAVRVSAVVAGHHRAAP